MSIIPTYQDQQAAVDAEDHRAEVALAAYLLFQRKGSQDGDAERNWLDAEASVKAKRASTVHVKAIGHRSSNHPIH